MSYADIEKRREYARETREWRKAHKICIRCGQNSVYKNLQVCLVCRMDQREYEKRSRDARKARETEEDRAARNLKRRLERQAKAERNECLACSNQRYQGYCYCYKHYISQKRAQNKYNREKRRKYYTEKGLCRICGEECTTRVDGMPSKFCEQHYQQYRERALIMNQNKLEELKMKAPEMRQDLLTKTKYSGTERWTEKVNKMTDRQVYAIWNRMSKADELRYNEK